MKTFLLYLLTASFVLSLMAALILLVRKLLFYKLSSRYLYRVWVLIFIGSFIPFGFFCQEAPVQIYLPNPAVDFSHSETQTEWQSKIFSDTPTEGTFGVSQPVSLAQAQTLKFPLPTVLVLIWLSGFTVVLLKELFKHLRFLRHIRRWGEKIQDGDTLALFFEEKRRQAIFSDIHLVSCPGIESPMLIGFIHSSILLPDRSFTKQELLYILRHELTHKKRKDLYGKLLISFVAAIHWWNPLLPLMKRTIEMDCEIACDQATLDASSLGDKVLYGKTILKLASTRTPTALSTYFYGGKRKMKERLQAMFVEKKAKFAITILGAVLILGLSFGTLFSFSFTRDPVEEITRVFGDINQIPESDLILEDGKINGLVQVDIQNQSYLVNTVRQTVSGNVSGLNPSLTLEAAKERYQNYMEPLFQKYPELRSYEILYSPYPISEHPHTSLDYAGKITLPDLDGHRVTVGFGYQFEIRDLSTITREETQAILIDCSKVFRQFFSQQDFSYFEDKNLSKILDDMNRLAAGQLTDNCKITFFDDENRAGIFIDQRYSDEEISLLEIHENMEIITNPY